MYRNLLESIVIYFLFLIVYIFLVYLKATFVVQVLLEIEIKNSIKRKTIQEDSPTYTNGLKQWTNDLQLKNLL